MKSKILITSVGSMVVQNILETLQFRREHLQIIGTDASTDAPLYDCDKVYLVPASALPPSDFCVSLSEIIKAENPDIIIPGRDIDVIILAHLKSEFPEIANRFITGTPEIGAMVEDKWLSHQFALQEGLPFADSVLFNPEDDKDGLERFIETYGYPLILKPRKGFASKTVKFILNEEQLFSNIDNGDLILQEYLGDPKSIFDFADDIANRGLPLFYSLEEIKYSVQLYIDSKHELSSSLVTLHRMKNGVSQGVDIYPGNELDDIIQNFARVLAKYKWHGPFNIQMQRSQKTGQFKAYEFNGRYTGATSARYALGYDEVGSAFKDLSVALDTCKLFNSQNKVIRQAQISKRPLTERGILEKKKVWEK